MCKVPDSSGTIRIVDKIGDKLDRVLKQNDKMVVSFKLLHDRFDQLDATVGRINERMFLGNGQPSVTTIQARHDEKLEDHEKQLDALWSDSKDQRKQCSKLHAKRSYSPGQMRAVTVPPAWRKPRTIVISGSAIAVFIPLITWAIWHFSGGNGPPPPLPPIPTAHQSAK